MYRDGFTLVSSESASSRLWIEHGKRSRRIAEYFGRELGQVAVNNFWCQMALKITQLIV